MFGYAVNAAAATPFLLKERRAVLWTPRGRVWTAILIITPEQRRVQALRHPVLLRQGRGLPLVHHPVLIRRVPLHLAVRAA